MTGSRRSAMMSDLPMVKTVNGKQIRDNCVTCGSIILRSSWLCKPCVDNIGTENIINTVNGMPDYLADTQYEKWLKLKLLKFINAIQD